MSKQDIIIKYQDKMNWHKEFYGEQNVKNAKNYWEYLPEDLPKPDSQKISTFADLWLCYPYDRNLIQEIKDIFFESGWEIKWEVKENELHENESIFKQHPRINLAVKDKNGFDIVTCICEFLDHVEGATCVRKVIGKETKEVDIVEYVCTEEG